jgi:periplasmic mercuric ion binding protein
MKNLFIGYVIILMLFLVFDANAQGRGKGKGGEYRGSGKGRKANYEAQKPKENIKEIQIVTSAQCGMCKERLENAMSMLKGIKSSNLNIENKIFTVQYNADEVTSDFIRQSVVNTGYDADGLEANRDAYKNLPKCCKKGGH